MTTDFLHSQSEDLKTWPVLQAVEPTGLKKAVIHLLEPHTPDSVISAYQQALAQWFPIMFDLQGLLDPSWDKNSLDLALLCLSIVLHAIPPQLSGDNATELHSIYLRTKSSLTSAEGLGIISFPVVQARILITLFEISHGFYPAAFISIGGAMRALDTLSVYRHRPDLSLKNGNQAATDKESLLAWCGVLVLDR